MKTWLENRKRALFLDRDGVINQVVLIEGKPSSPRTFSDFKLKEGVGELLDELKREGFLLIVVTNQPDVVRGLLPKAELDKMHSFIRERLPIDDLRVCLHDDADNCQCRKPKPGLLLEAARKWGIDLEKSYLLGDSWKDMEAGRATGCRTILLEAPYNEGTASDRRVKSLKEAGALISGEG